MTEEKLDAMTEDERIRYLQGFIDGRKFEIDRQERRSKEVDLAPRDNRREVSEFMSKLIERI